MPPEIRLPDPELQVSFASRFEELRELFLQDALRRTVKGLAIGDVDRDLAHLVPAHSLAVLAGHGLRGELMFPVPTLLLANPRLLGYYRLLYGYSQKEFYSGATGLGRFKLMEERGLAPKEPATVENLCAAMCVAGTMLLAAIGGKSVTAMLLHDLSLLTLGPPLRGGANVRRGVAGIRAVFGAIRDIVESATVSISDTRLLLRNAAGRTVLIELAADPDITIRENMPSGQRQLIAIEVKASSDFSNIHNRIGEAEKSHHKARAAGYVECWTVVNVDKIDINMAHRESASTNRFYRISSLLAGQGEEYTDFRDRIISLTGVVAA